MADTSTHDKCQADPPKAYDKDLQEAMKSSDYIRVVRRIKKADQLTGYVVGLGRSWVLMAIPTDGSPDGFVAIRVSDIKAIYFASGGRFMRHSLEAQGAWPPPAPDYSVDLDHEVKELVDSVAAAGALVAIYPELEHTDACYIGRPCHWGKRKLHLHEVTPEGRWEDTIYKHTITAITRIEFATIYNKNLAVVAGPLTPHK